MVERSRPLIEPGQVVATPGAIQALEDAKVQVLGMVHRHLSGDWGVFGTFEETVVTDRERELGPMATDDDAKLNRIATEKNDGSRILSKYQLNTAGGTIVWVVTEGDGTDRVTTVLLPSEY